jgi:hypothetical protein
MSRGKTLSIAEFPPDGPGEESRVLALFVETKPTLEPVNRRPGYLVSTLIHVILVSALIERTLYAPTRPIPAGVRPEDRARVVMLPPAAVLRQFAEPPSRPAKPLPQPEPNLPPNLVRPPLLAVPPTVRPTPLPDARNTMRVGPRSGAQAAGPLILTPGQKLSSAELEARRGRPGPMSTPTPEPLRLGREERSGIGGPGTDPSPKAAVTERSPVPGSDLPLGPDGRAAGRPGVAGTAAQAPGGQRSTASSL